MPRIAALVLPACFALGCAGYATVDGYDAEYVDPPPPAVVEAPAYRVNDGYIYVVEWPLLPPARRPLGHLPALAARRPCA